MPSYWAEKYENLKSRNWNKIVLLIFEFLSAIVITGTCATVAEWAVGNRYAYFAGGFGGVVIWGLLAWLVLDYVDWKEKQAKTAEAKP